MIISMIGKINEIESIILWLFFGAEKMQTPMWQKRHQITFYWSKLYEEKEFWRNVKMFVVKQMNFYWSVVQGKGIVRKCEMWKCLLWKQRGGKPSIKPFFWSSLCPPSLLLRPDLGTKSTNVWMGGRRGRGRRRRGATILYKEGEGNKQIFQEQRPERLKAPSMTSRYHQNGYLPPQFPWVLHNIAHYYPIMMLGALDHETK